MASKGEYKQSNINFLKQKSAENGITKLNGGVLAEIINSGTGTKSPNLSSVVIVYYKGYLIDGTPFDDNTDSPCPDAFRLREVIEGWQIALPKMHAGDKWRIYIPATLGYGGSRVDNIPPHSTLIFEIELVNFQ